MTPIPAFLRQCNAFDQVENLKLYCNLQKVHFDRKTVRQYGSLEYQLNQDEREVVSVLEKVAVWTVGRHVKKRFTLQHEILEVCWTHFSSIDDAEDKDDIGPYTLCLLMPGLLTTYSANGEIHETALASGMTKMWPLRHGLLLGDACGSCVSLLPHPLAEARPVVGGTEQLSLLHGKHSTMPHHHPQHSISLTGWSGEEVVWSTPSLALVATYSEGSGRIAIWAMCRSQPGDLDALGNLNDLPAATPMPEMLSGGAAFSGGLGRVLSRSGRYATPPPARSGLGPASSSTMKRPCPRTPEGYLAPDVFKPAPKFGINAPSTAHWAATSPIAFLGASPWGAMLNRGGAPGPGASGASGGLSAAAGGLGTAVPLTNMSVTVPGKSANVFMLLHKEILPDGARPTEGHTLLDASDGSLLLAFLCKKEKRMILMRVLVTTQSKGAGPSGSHATHARPAAAGTAHTPTPSWQAAPGINTAHTGEASAPCLLLTAPALSMTTLSLSTHHRSSRFCTELMVLEPSLELAVYQGAQALVRIQLMPAPSPQLHTSSEAQASTSGLQAAAQVSTPPPGLTPGRDTDDDDDDDMDLGCSDDEPGTPDAVIFAPGSHVKAVIDGEAELQSTPASHSRHNIEQPPAAPVPVAVLSNCRSCLTVQLVDGSMAEVDIALSPLTPLPRLALRALKRVLSADDVLRLSREILQDQDGTCGCPEREWQAFSRVFLNWAAGSDESRAVATAAGGRATAEASFLSSPSAAYTPLQTRRFAAMRLASMSPASVKKHQPLTTATNAPAAAPGHALEQLSGPSSPWEQLLKSPLGQMIQSEQRYPWLASETKPGKDAMLHVETETEPIIRPTVTSPEVALSALWALHSIYEDLKLNMLSWGLLSPLGSTLASLAQQLGQYPYWEHYVRDLGRSAVCPPPIPGPASGAPDQESDHAMKAPSSSSFTFPQLTPKSEGEVPSDEQPSVDRRRPPCIHSLLSTLLGGRVPTTEELPLLVTQEDGSWGKLGEGVVRRSRLVLDCYGRLAEFAAAAGRVQLNLCQSASGGDADIREQAAASFRKLLKQTSEDVVLEMVKAGWTAADLDLLPAGVALPLREAMQRCRGEQPSGWPVEAYALVGREDIAATLALTGHNPSNSGPTATHPTSPSPTLKITQPPTTRAAATAATQPDWHWQLPHAALHTASTLEQASQASAVPRTLPGLSPVTPVLMGLGGTAAVSPQLGWMRPGGLFASWPKNASGVSDPQYPLPSAAVHSIYTPAFPAVKALIYPEWTGEHHIQPRSWRTWTAAYMQRLGVHLSLEDIAAESQSLGSKTVNGKAKADAKKEAYDGMDSVLRVNQAGKVSRFSRDTRLSDAATLLSSGAPVSLRLSTQEGDPELESKRQMLLMAEAVRTMALPLGRGALTLGTADVVPAEPLPVPSLCLAGRHAGATINLDLADAAPAPGGGAAAEFTAWPEFHNGVAAGLRLTPVPAEDQEHPGKLHPLNNHSWVGLSRPHQPPYTHAGLIMALGLTGHLDALTWTDLYRYLAEQHDATTIGVMLGMAAAKRGSLDALVSRMLFLHLPSRHPNTFPEIELSPLVQAAALMGVGLLYQGSCHRLMAEIMLEELGRRPPPVPGGGLPWAPGREGYALSAGFALGLITLGKGAHAPGLVDLGIEDRLRTYMDGTGATLDTNGPDGKGTGGPPASGPARVFQGKKGGVDPSLGEAGWRGGGLNGLFGKGPEGSDDSGTTNIAQVVLEPMSHNVAVTSPAATLALALMYLRTNNRDIAARFTVPNTYYELDAIRPDFICLRVLGRGLVMWDEVGPGSDWVEAQLPPLIAGPLERLIDTVTAGRGGMQVPRGRDPLAVALAHIYALTVPHLIAASVFVMDQLAFPELSPG